jgi:hypothetical protein
MSSIRFPQGAIVADQVFVGREQELAHVWQFLDRALGSQGQVCFVTGLDLISSQAPCGQFVQEDHTLHVFRGEM